MIRLLIGILALTLWFTGLAILERLIYGGNSGLHEI